MAAPAQKVRAALAARGAFSNLPKKTREQGEGGKAREKGGAVADAECLRPVCRGAKQRGVLQGPA